MKRDTGIITQAEHIILSRMNDPHIHKAGLIRKWVKGGTACLNVSDCGCTVCREKKNVNSARTNAR